MSPDRDPFFTIIVPVYNAGAFLKDCIESILQQSFAKFELILVDDGSLDGSHAICQDFGRKDARVKFIAASHGGVSRARNAGLDKAAGSYILFSDADDVFLPGALHTYYETILRTQADIVKCGYEEFADHHATTHAVPRELFIRNHDTATMLKETERSCYFGFLWNTAFRRSCTEGIRFDTSISWLEDHVFSRRCFARCKSMILIPATVYRHIIRDNSLSFVHDPFMMADASIAEYKSRIELLYGKERKRYEQRERLIYGRLFQASRLTYTYPFPKKIRFMKHQFHILKQIKRGRSRYFLTLFRLAFGISK